jgi:K+/H+ antiporter YhaU regulatory subunit KhtT
MIFNPGPEYVLHGGDTVITLGDKDQLVRLAATL